MSEKLITDLLKVIKTHINLNSTDSNLAQLDKQLNVLEDELFMSETESETKSEIELDSIKSNEITVEITLRDLAVDVQKYIANNFKYDDIETMFTERPELETQLFCLRVFI
jgi:hypothetical protein